MSLDGSAGLERHDGALAAIQGGPTTLSATGPGPACRRTSPRAAETATGVAIGWRRLLTAFDADPGRAAARYRAARARVVAVVRGRGGIDPEAIADEAFERAARRLGDGEVMRGDPAPYVLGIARLVALEDGRRARRLRGLDHDPPAPPPPADDELGRALERCLAALDDDARALLIAYHTGDGADRIATRRRLAAELGIGLNALRIRAHRLRAHLEASVRVQLEPAKPLPKPQHPR